MWIQSDCDLPGNPKTLDLMAFTGYDVDTVLGKLHRFWYWVSKYAEDGDLRKFNDGQLARAVGLEGPEADKFIKAMVEACWLDRKPYFRVHDWWDYFGMFLQSRHKRHPEIWERVRTLYSTICSGNCTSDCTGYSTGYCNRPPNLTEQNITKQDVDVCIESETGVDVTAVNTKDKGSDMKTPVDNHTPPVESCPQAPALPKSKPAYAQSGHGKQPQDPRRIYMGAEGAALMRENAAKVNNLVSNLAKQKTFPRTTP